jgi:hypothetical protein
VPQPVLNAFNGLPGVALVPELIEVLGHQAELNDKVAGEVLRLGLAALLAPELEEGRLIGAHDHPGIRAADERPALGRIEPRAHETLPAMPSAACWMAPVTSDARSDRTAGSSSPPGTFCAVSSRTTAA